MGGGGVEQSNIGILIGFCTWFFIEKWHVLVHSDPFAQSAPSLDDSTTVFQKETAYSVTDFPNVRHANPSRPEKGSGLPMFLQSRAWRGYMGVKLWCREAAKGQRLHKPSAAFGTSAPQRAFYSSQSFADKRHGHSINPTLLTYCTQC